MTKKFDINILQKIFSYSNIYNLDNTIEDNTSEKSICMLMAKTNQRKRKLWIEEFKTKVAKMRYEESRSNKLKEKYTHLINHIKFIFSSESIEIKVNKEYFKNYNYMGFTIIISNYGSFGFSIINGDDDTNIYIYDIVEPEHILDVDFGIIPEHYIDEDELDDEYYLKNIYKEGDIETIIRAIWFTPFWKKRMPENKDYIVMN